MNRTKKEILEKIKNKEIKMKPRWEFWAEDISKKSSLVLMLLLAAIGMSMVVAFWQIYNPPELTKYGEVGWELIKEDFPYYWLFGAVVLGVGGGILQSRLGENYKKTTIMLILLTTLMIVGLTVLAVITRNLLKIGL